AFRTPKFLVTVTGSQGELRMGTTLKAQVSGKYLFGAPMKGAGVSWSAARSMGRFAPAGYDDFTFTSDPAKRTPRILASGQGILGPKGELPVTIALPKGASHGPMELTLEAEVVDIDRQTIAGRKLVTVHPATPYVGVRLTDPIAQTSKPVSFEAVTLSPSGVPVGKGTVSMTVFRRSWYWSWETDSADRNQQINEGHRDKKVHTCALRLEKGRYHCRANLREPGYHVVVTTVKDNKGNSHTASREFYVSGWGGTAQKRSPFVPLDISLKKKVLVPGDRGEVIIPSPYKSGFAMVTVEKHGVHHRQTVALKQGVTTVSFPVTQAMVPGAYVGVYLVRGRSTGKRDAAGRDLGGPEYRMGYKPFLVRPVNNVLGVRVSTSRKVGAPGQKLTMQVKTTLKGQAKSAEVALFVVDEGVLSLTSFATPDPRRGLLPYVALRLWATDSRGNLLARFNSLYGSANPGGGGGEEDGMGGPRSAKTSTRKNFKSTLYWNPRLVTNDKGEASVTVTLPDNLTTFRIMAVAIDEADHFGSAQNKVVVRKPFMLEAALPRFLTVGDTFEASVVAHNQTKAPLSARISLAAQNCQVTGPLTKTQMIRPGTPEEIKFPVRVTAPGPVTFTFSGIPAVGSGDSVSHTITAQPLSLWKSSQVQTVVRGKKEIRIAFPEGTIPQGAEFNVELSRSSLTGLRDSLDYLVKYPYGCVEQTTSSTYPLLALMDLLPAMGVTKHSPQKLRKMAQMGINRLAKMRTGSGGLSYWPGGYEPHLYGSAYAMLALLKAREKKLDIPDDFHIRVASYLRYTVSFDKVSMELKAYVAYVLSHIGTKDVAMLTPLYLKRKDLSLYGKSMLLMAFKRMMPKDDRIEQLAAEVAGHFTPQGDLKPVTVKGKTPARNYDIFESPLKTRAAVLMALLETGGHDPLVTMLAKGIMASQKRGYWYTTQQTIYGLMALSAYAKHSNPANSALRVSMDLGQKSLDESLNTVNAQIKRYSFNMSRLVASKGSVLTIRNRGTSSAPVYVTLRARYSVKTRGPVPAEASKGITLFKRIQTLKGKPVDARGVKGGDLVLVRIFAYIPYGGKVKYLAINDPLPAGLEALDPRLTTSSTLSVGSARDSFMARNSMYAVSFSEIKEDRVLFFCDNLYGGYYEFRYLARATSLGQFQVPPAFAEAMYDPEVRALSESTVLKVH
ncbi:hypothetical protein KJ865_04510, partial [Myxococcota bacterium]|nr:hypothetical protein [Myxococcota bacterium]